MTTTEVHWLPKAERDLNGMTSCYFRISPALADTLQHEVEQIVVQLRQFPLSYASVATNLRRACLNRFPFAIFYRSSSNRVTIAAVLPQRSDPHFIRRSLQKR